jgi:hypothetical protein
MRFRLGLVVGFAAGYYFGSRAGRERFEQINRLLRRVRRSDTFDTATDKARAIVDLGVERARDVFDGRTGHGGGDDVDLDSPWPSSVDPIPQV